MYVILGGTADVLIDTPSGQISVAEMKRNSFFGEIAILCDVPRTATIKAKEPLATLKITKDMFYRLVAEFPEMAIEIHARAGASPRGHQPETARRHQSRLIALRVSIMSRLDSFIARMQAQRDCLNFLKPAIDAVPGPILEVGLGNGRTYDHLRELFPRRDIFVFERKVAGPSRLHPRLTTGCSSAMPTGRSMKPPERLGATAALIHTDLGTGDHQANVEMGKWLGPALDRLAVSGGYVLANQTLDVARWQRLPEPPAFRRTGTFSIACVSGRRAAREPAGRSRRSPNR
jgi:hypothetical protein